MNKKRALFALNRYLPAVSGSEILNSSIIDALIGMGIDTDVCTLNVKNETDYTTGHCSLLKEEVINNANVRRFPVTRIPYKDMLFRNLEKHNILKYYTGFRKSVSIPFSVYIDSAVKNYDYVFTGVMPFTSIIWPTLLSAKKHKVKSILIPLMHLGPLHHDRYRYEYFSKECIELYKMADAVIVLGKKESEFLKSIDYGGEIEKLYPYVGKRKNGKTKSGDFTILTLGYQDYEKGIDTTIKAFEIFLKNVPDSRLIIVGRMNDERKRAIKNIDRIVCFEYVDEMFKEDLYNSADIFVQPSIAESFSIATIEAHAHGVPSINAVCSGSLEIIKNGENGFLVPFGDYLLTYKYIMQLYTKEEQRFHMGRRAEEMSEIYSRENMQKQIEGLIKKL